MEFATQPIKRLRTRLDSFNIFTKIITTKPVTNVQFFELLTDPGELFQFNNVMYPDTMTRSTFDKLPLFMKQPSQRETMRLCVIQPYTNLSESTIPSTSCKAHTDRPIIYFTQRVFALDSNYRTVEVVRPMIALQDPRLKNSKLTMTSRRHKYRNLPQRG